MNKSELIEALAQDIGIPHREAAAITNTVIDTMTDYCLGDGMFPTAPGTTGRMIDRWWNHPKNLMGLRMVPLSDELARAGDLFITLHRNPADGLSYVRAIPKDQIVRVETLDNDWETETVYHQRQGILAARHVAILGGVVDDLVEGEEHRLARRLVGRSTHGTRGVHHEQ